MEELIPLPNQVSPYEKKFIRTNELLFITRLIGSFQAFLHLFSAKKSINVYFGAMLNVYSADLPWISELFCGKRRGKCITYSTAPPLFGLQTGVGDFTQKSPKDAVKRWCLTFLPTHYTHHMKKGSSENEPFYKS